MTTKEQLQYILNKQSLPGILSPTIEHMDWVSESVQIYAYSNNLDALNSIVNSYNAFLTYKYIQPGERTQDFLFRTCRYSTEEIPNASNMYPLFRDSEYKSLAINVCKYFPIYTRGYQNVERKLTIRYTKDDVFIGNGIILNKNFHLLFAIKGDIERDQNNSIKFSNPYCIIDKSVFCEKTVANTFIKNTMFPMVVDLGYRVEIDDFSTVEVFNHPIPPQTYDIKEEITQLLLDNIAKDNSVYEHE